MTQPPVGMTGDASVRYWDIRDAHDSLAGQPGHGDIEPGQVLHNDVIALAAQQPFYVHSGGPAYPDPWQKAGVAVRIIAQRHPFTAGNKRTAWLYAVTLLGQFDARRCDLRLRPSSHEGGRNEKTGRCGLDCIVPRGLLHGALWGDSASTTAMRAASVTRIVRSTCRRTRSSRRTRSGSSPHWCLRTPNSRSTAPGGSVPIAFKEMVVEKYEVAQITNWSPDNDYVIARLRFDPPRAYNLRAQGPVRVGAGFRTSAFHGEPEHSIDIQTLRQTCDHVRMVVGLFEQI